MSLGDSGNPLNQSDFTYKKLYSPDFGGPILGNEILFLLSKEALWVYIPSQLMLAERD